MKKYLLTIIILLIYFGSIYADTIIVDCNGGGHYLTIQEGIDASQDNDIVLVYQGIYHETIVIDGKDIVVGSLYYTTQDPSYISQTVIKGDGSSPYSIIELQNTMSTIIGFTILGPEPQTGILSWVSIPSIEHNIIQNTEIGIRVQFKCPYIYKNSIYNNDLGIQISSVSDPKAPGVFNNIIHDNVKGIECSSESSPLIMNNIIYNNLQYGISCNWFDTPEIFNNVIYGNNVGIQIIFHSEPNICNNTISVNHTGILAYSNTYAHISNSIIYGNDFNLSEYEPGILTEIYIAYSCIGDGVPNWCIDEGGNISEDPYFVDPNNDNYSLTWNSNYFSPCIDTGDPNTTWDPDNTPPDMGAIPAVAHDYFYNQYDGGIIDRVEWISFPALN
ncbi:MAG: right-handed parallel beta-helix repeat-containing protein, partial [Candidatus Cloacimonadota bacterium]|nr:right-handed parallel beta-helix repeat-containing protein [Candidatus Cloacimonadota bacterium]